MHPSEIKTTAVIDDFATEEKSSVASQRLLTVLGICIAVLAAIAAAMGIFYQAGDGPFRFISIHGQEVTISGEGLYRFMSADVAIQGKAQDFITLFIAVPFLLTFIFLSRKNNLRFRLILAGTIAYFLVTYTFYLSMGAYNEMFLVYAALSGLSFISFYLAVKLVNKPLLYKLLKNARPAFPAWVLMVNALMIAFLWLSIVVPPLLEGSLFPASLEHYTTLIVQGYDLGILLPLSFLAGLLLLKRINEGILLAPIYLVFLSFLMLALIAKIVGMSLTGVPVGLAIVIIPVIWMISVFSAGMLLKKL
jgi:hypothetical protein